MPTLQNIPTVAERRVRDKEREALRKLDQVDGGSRLYEWTLRTYNMARPRKDTTVAKLLIEALDFVSIAGTKEQDHLILKDKFAIMYDGQLAAGYPIIEDLNCCPHLGRLKTALAKCGESLSITELDSGKLSVVGAKLRALVPCLDPDIVPLPVPDQSVAVADNWLKQAFTTCGTLASENAEDFICASVLLENGVCSSTNKKVLFQFWHGLNIPAPMVLPKIFTAAVAKTKRNIVGMGAGWNAERAKFTSFTVHFDNGAWIKTQLYENAYPDVSKIIDVATVQVPIPDGLWEGAAIVSEFSPEDDVYFVEDGVQSHVSEHEGAQYKVPGLPGGLLFGGDVLKLVAPWATSIDFTSQDSKIVFHGDRMRGIAIGKYTG